MARSVTRGLILLPALAAWQASGNFVASLHTNYVVNLDFDSTATSSLGLDSLEDEDVKVMSFAGGKRKFRCRLPGGKNESGASQLPGALDAKSHFLAAKLAPLRGSCLSFTKDYWSYDVCHGRKVVQYRTDAKLRNSLGEHHAQSDQLLPTGEVREFYFGGTENRSTEVRYVCGTARQADKEVNYEVTEEPKLHYIIEMTGPAFCTWKDRDGMETTASDGSRMLITALLEPLRGRCLNTTQGWWTYEYCYPKNLMQFHLEGSKRDPEYTLGTLEGTTQSQAVNRVNMSMIRLKPSMSPRERRAPPSGHLTLQQKIGGGTVCDETGRGRQTSLHFQCPANWQSRPETQIVSLTESALCEYEVLIHTTLLCGHHKLMPTLPRGKETIQCVADAS
eukprot:TRINITY_DN95689_c0_g1_i1.p1 TRINITY_DN95689_c0_g1~~TRINITY_DN95689_c0_g1_i1.p1  ORF type:complete len:392 (+),score=77.79 TRINITY_DN95689_c0_g1_i1:39-1214(+)